MINSVLQSNVVVKKGARVENAIVMENITVEGDQVIGDSATVSLVSEDGIRVE